MLAAQSCRPSVSRSTTGSPFQSALPTLHHLSSRCVLKNGRRRKTATSPALAMVRRERDSRKNLLDFQGSLQRVMALHLLRTAPLGGAVFLCVNRLEVAENGIAHSLLQARAGARRGSGELVENSTEDHKGDLTVVGRFGTRERG